IQKKKIIIMKKIHKVYAWLSCLLMLSMSSSAFAQENSTSSDSTEIENKEQIDLTPSIGKKDYDYLGEEIKFPRVFGGLTISRIDWGFSRLIDDGSFTLSEGNNFLKYKKASNFGFDIAQFGVRFNDKFKTYVSAGFEWNYLRLKQNIILDTEATPLAYTES